MGRWVAFLCFASLAGCLEGAPGPQGEPGQGTPGAKGDKGDPGGPEGAPSISGILPSTVYRQHDVDVTITGFATTWKEGATPDLSFGPGITAGPVTVGSPTSLTTHLTIDADAALGPRDVEVGGLVYASAFNVEAPLSIYVLPDTGSPKQGSIVKMEAYQEDVARPYQLPLRFFLRNGSYELSDGLLTNATPYTLLSYQFIDVLAPAGPTDGVAESGFAPITSVAPGGITVEARSPVELTGATVGTVTEPRESLLYRFGTTDAAWMHASVASTNPAASAGFVSLPASGRFDDRTMISPGSLDQARFRKLHVLMRANDTRYVVFWDPSGESGYDFDLDVQSTDPADVLHGEIAGPADYEFYEVEALAGETIVAVLGDGLTSVCGFDFAATVYVIRESDGATLLYDATSVCPGQPEPVTVTVPTDGRYLVVFSASEPLCQGMCGAFDFSAIVEVQP